MKQLFSLLICFMTMAVYAQDVIVKRDGSTILSKVLEVNPTDIKYKKFSNPDGPTYTVEKSEIMAINYENGDKETFNENSVSQGTSSPSTTSKTSNAEPDAHNAELIALYNRTHSLSPKIKESDKLTKHGCFFMAVAENSVLSTDEVEILFVQEPYHEHIDGSMLAFYFLTSKYIVQVHNKTDKTLYLDMGNTSRVLADGTSKIYFDISQTTISKGDVSGVSLGLGKNLGGGVLGNVGIGSGSTANTSKTYAKQRVMAVPPHGKIPLEVYQQVHVKGNHYEVITEGENSLHAFPKGEQPKVSCGRKITYDVDSSPFRAQYTINYATNEDLSDAKNISATLYMRDLYGLKSLTWDKGKGSEKKVIDEIKETVPDYDNHTILGGWYTNWR